MARVRFSTFRSGHHRGGLVFALPAASRLGDGRLAIVVDDAKAEELGEANLRALFTDPAITADKVGSDGLTAAERAAVRHEALRQAAAEKAAQRQSEARRKADQAAYERLTSEWNAGPARPQIPPAPAAAASRTDAAALTSAKAAPAGDGSKAKAK